MSVATSTAIGLGIAAAGSVATGVIGANAAGNAASTQANAANNAAQLQANAANNSLDFSKLQYGNTLALESPFYNSGVAANSQLDYLMGLKPQTGLPAGVVNPNAPQISTTANGSQLIGGRTSGLPGGIIGSGESRSVGPVLAANATAPIVNGSGTPANAFSASVASPLGTSSTNSPIQASPLGTATTNSPIQASPLGGTAPATNNTGIGNPIISPTGITDPTSSAPASGQPNNNTITGISPINGGTFSLGSSTGTGAPVTSANGQPGTAPVVNPGAAPGATAAPSGTNGSFGSLAQGWDQTFNSPTNVTEQNDPGFQFRQDQGTTALQNSAAARGGLLTGGTAKALTDFAQNDASNEYANVYNRALNNYNTNYNTFTNDQTNEFNRLADLSGEGQVSANQLSTAGLNTANQVGSTLLTAGNQIGNNINNAGAANASGFVGGANAINSGISGLSSTASLLAMLNQQNQNTGAQAA